MDREATPGDPSSDRQDAHAQESTPRFVGRSRERAGLRAELALALAGHGRVCLIAGEAGIGKTTLARDLAGVAGGLGARVLTGSCYDLTNSPPYGPWLDLFEACQRDATLPEPPAALAGGHLAPVADQAALFADVRRFLAATAERQPVLVILEDLHWADPASLDLLRHIAPHLRHWPMLLVVTYRVDELFSGRPLTHHLPALIREGEASRFDLRRLDEAALRALVALRYPLAQPDQDLLIAYLDRHAEGNPFFAAEILRSLEEEGLLRPVDGGWALAALDYVVVPPLLRRVIEERVVRLGPDLRAPLAIAAVLGHELPLALWADVADLPDEALLGIVESAVEAHLLEAARDGTQVRFVHALTREALYESILPPRRRAWHLRIAESLLASSRPDPEAVALHLQAAGDPRAAEWLIAAGERARQAYAWLTASERFQAAALLLQGVEGQEHVHRRLVMRVAHLLRFANPASSIRALDEAERLATGAGDTVTLGEVYFQRGVTECYADQFRAGIADIRRGYDVLDAAAPDVGKSIGAIGAWLRDVISVNVSGELPEDAVVIARMRETLTDFRRFGLGWYLAAGGYLQEATVETERYIAAFDTVPGERVGFRLLAAFAHHGLATVHAARGRPGDARRSWEQARQEFRALDHLVLLAFVMLDELRDVTLTFGAADPAARRQLAADTEATLARASSTLHPGVSPRIAWVRCLVMDGRWDEAWTILGDLPHPGNCFLRRERTFACAELARHRGDPARAWDEIVSLLPQGPATEPGDIIHQEGLALQRLAADLCLDAGDLDGAALWLEAHDRWLGWSGSVLGRADGRVAWGRHRLLAGDLDQARADLEDALSLAASPDQPLVRLVAHRLLGEIDLAGGRLAGAGAHLDAAMALADACEVPFERGLTLLALAGLREAEGAPGEAAARIVEARDIGERLGAVTILRRADALAKRAEAQPAAAHPFGLTSRELDVLRLLARQRTDREIAEALFISPHTASTHVKHVLAKLDVANRRDAADVAVAIGIA